MKNADRWVPSKYVYHRGRLRASRLRNRGRREVQLGSLLITDLVAQLYDRHLKTHAHGRLLDLGCGRVPLYEAYRERICTCTCVDWANTIHQSEYVDHECDLNEPLPLDDASFDTIVLSDVLEHLHNPGSLWSEMARLLAPGGKIIMNTPFFYQLHEIPHDYYRYTEYALRRFADESGLNVIKIESVGGFPEVATDLTVKFMLRLPNLMRICMRPIAIGLQWFTFSFVNTRPGRSISRRSGRLTPLGYFLVVEKSNDTHIDG